MRPAILDRLFAPVTALPGIGPQLARLFERLAGPLVVDLLWHLPAGIVDRRAAPPIRDLEADRIVDPAGAGRGARSRASGAARTGCSAPTTPAP